MMNDNYSANNQAVGMVLTSMQNQIEDLDRQNRDLRAKLAETQAALQAEVVPATRSPEEDQEIDNLHYLEWTVAMLLGAIRDGVLSADSLVNELLDLLPVEMCDDFWNEFAADLQSDGTLLKFLRESR